MLFGPRDVDWLKVDKSTRIGKGRQGSVYLGRIKFKGAPSRQVAVKIYPEPNVEHLKLILGPNWNRTRLGGDYSLKGERLTQMIDIIERFTRANVRMPKFGIVEHQGKPVLVSSLFIRNRTSKLTELQEHPDKTRLILENEGLSIKISRELAKMANAGYIPPYPEDVFHVYEKSDGTASAIVGEVDPEHFVAVGDDHDYFHRAPHADPLKNAVHFFKAFNGDPVLRQKTVRAFFEGLSPELKIRFLMLFRHQVHPRKILTLNEAIRYKSDAQVGEINQAWDQKRRVDAGYD